MWGSTKSGKKSILSWSLNRGTKTKVSDFKVVIFVKQQVLRFEISVAYVLAMAVRKAIHELSEVVSCNSLRECTSMKNEVEELATFAEFECNELKAFRLTLFFVNAFSKTDLLNHIRVV